MFEGFFGIIIGICAIAISIAWIILPFAVFGIKQRLDTMIELQRSALISTCQKPQKQETKQIHKLRVSSNFPPVKIPSNRAEAEQM
jgi:hypothetical protein